MNTSRKRRISTPTQLARRCETEDSDDYIWFDLIIKPFINHNALSYMNEKQTSAIDLERESRGKLSTADQDWFREI